jgi:putative Holliday junction resolvase
MGRILSIDYGLKRTGIAVTDPLRIIASGLCTIETPKLVKFLKEYCGIEPVEQVIIGMPLNLNDTDTDATPLVRKFIQVFRRDFPHIPITEVDERYTSRRASQAMIEMGMKKSKRREKGMVDEIAAAIMLQEFLENHPR